MLGTKATALYKVPENKKITQTSGLLRLEVK